MPKRRVSNASPAVAWLRQNTIGSVAVGSFDQLVGMQLAVGRGMALHGGEILVRDAHHAGAHRAAPARRGRGGRRDARIAHRLLGRAERKAMRAIGELEQLAVGAERRVARNP